ncbi:MAG: permease-like cell division protein FtsX [Schwartzia sp.]|nr:permease-like cell division protein FtsX [Schwartzia sp. (in: firmicutes)]
MKISTGEYIVRETVLSLKRNSWMAFASIGTVAVSLLVLGMFLILVLNMNRMVASLESQVEISVYVLDEVSETELRTLEERIASMQGIQSVKLIDKEKAMELFRERLGDQQFLLDALGDNNPLPNSFEVRVIQPDMVRTAAEAIRELPGVETAKYGQDVVEHLFDITRLVRLFGLALMFVLALATLFIISNTIRLTVFARRKEVAIMKYVGATDWFIRWPFLLEGIVLGCFGGVVAALALRGVYRVIAVKIYDTLAFFPLIPENPFLHYVTAAILVCGMFIGALGSTISLKKFLNA